MSIPISNYVDITSVVGGGAAVATRNLGAMIISINPRVPTGQVISFNSAASVGAYFGTSSGEYARALFYFGWISKNGKQPDLLSFWFWNQNAATDSLIFGAPPIDTLSQFQAITTGDFTLTMGGYTDHLTGVNFSTATSLGGSGTSVASLLQTAIRAISAGSTAWTSATVTYDATSGAFDLASGVAGADTITIAAGVVTDMAGPLGWLSSATVLSNGSAAQSVTANLNALINISNNFGSFCFGATVSNPPTLQNLTDAANWNNSLTPNIQFIFSARCTPSQASSYEAALALIGGTTLTLAPINTEYLEMVPMMILSATDYTAQNSVQNYMWQVFDLTPSVTNITDFNTYTALNINFYGQTQTAGQLLTFYQPGVMYGLSTQPLNQNTYGNEIWLKDAMAASIMTLLLSLAQIPANASGRAQLLSIVQSVINQALFNGTISVGKTLSTTQQLYITNATGSNTAWQQVQNIGYWVDAEIISYVVAGVTQYKAVYTLIYSKDDVIRFVSGTDILI